MTIPLTLAFCLLSVEPRSLTIKEAREMVLVAAGPHNRGLYLEPYNNPALSAFYLFQGLREAPAGASPSVGFFAVDRRTGDVWSAVVCDEYKSAALARQQQKLRKHIGLSNADYRQLRSPGPMCESAQQ
jgi:hypothetical protein